MRSSSPDFDCGLVDIYFIMRNNKKEPIDYINVVIDDDSAFSREALLPPFMSEVIVFVR